MYLAGPRTVTGKSTPSVLSVVVYSRRHLHTNLLDGKCTRIVSRRLDDVRPSGDRRTLVCRSRTNTHTLTHPQASVGGKEIRLEKQEKAKTLDSEMFVHSIVTSALTHETPSPLRKRKEVDLDIRNQEKGTKNKSGETGKKKSGGK